MSTNNKPHYDVIIIGGGSLAATMIRFPFVALIHGMPMGLKFAFTMRSISSREQRLVRLHSGLNEYLVTLQRGDLCLHCAVVLDHLHRQRVREVWLCAGLTGSDDFDQHVAVPQRLRQIDRQLGAILGDASGFVFLPHHKTGNILQEEKRDAALFA